MKLLFDAHHLGRRQGGNETWTRNIAAAARDLLADDVLHFAVTAAGVDGVPAGPAHLVSERSTRRLLVDLPRIARQVDADALLVTYAMPPTRRPCVVVVHDVSFRDRASRHWLPLRTRVRMLGTAPASCWRAAHVIVGSEFTRRYLVEKLWLTPERISVAPYGVDPELLALLKSAERHPAEPFTVLAVGEVLPRKNLVALAGAVRACLDRGVAMRLRVVGKVLPHAQGEADRIVELLREAVSFTGYVSLPDLAMEYASADVLCYPSLFEGFGLPLVEAMAAGVPVIASNATCLPEVAGGAALLCDPRDANAWRDALLRVSSDRGLRDELVGRGRERAAQFSWHESARIVVDALSRAASQGRAEVAG